MISFIIRTSYNRRGCLEQAIKSVLAQSEKEIEIVLVENGSEQLQAWLDRFSLTQGQSISYYHLAEADRCAAGNLGLEKARGEFLCFLDDDDEVYENYAKAMLQPFLTDPELDAVCALAHEVKSSITSHTPFVYTDHERYIEYSEPFSRELLWLRNFLPIQSVLFRKRLFEQYGGFDPELSVLEDWELWVRYSTNNKFLSIPVVTSVYRVPQENSKRIAREDAFRDHYFKAIEKQKRNITQVDAASYGRIIHQVLLSYKSLNLLYKLRLVNYEKLCRIEHEKYPRVAALLTTTTPRDAIDCAKKQLQENRLIRFLTLSEHHAKTKVRRLISLIRSTPQV